MWESEAPSQEDASISGKWDRPKAEAGLRAVGSGGRPLHLEARHEARRGHWGLSSSPGCAQPPFPSDLPIESVRELGTELGASDPGSGWSEAGGGGGGGEGGGDLWTTWKRTVSELMLPSFCPLLNSGVVWGKGFMTKASRALF